jgi:hypothetical protein
MVPLKDKASAMTGMAAILRDLTFRFEELRELRRRAAETVTLNPNSSDRNAPLEA